MLFQGQEFAASSPFLYFADHKPEMAELVKDGRRRFLAQFRSLALPEMWSCFADPADPDTFRRSKLDHSERARHREIWTLHRDLLRLRREEPALSAQKPRGVDGAVLSSEALVLRFFGEKRPDDRLLVVNFGVDLHLQPAPEPLLAPPLKMEWDVLWSSEAREYGGIGVPQLDTVNNWMIPGQAAVLLKPAARVRTPYQG